MKKVIPVIIITALLASIITFAVFATILRPKALDIGTVDLNTIDDGEYIGICQNKILFAVVKVETKDHKIMDIEILEHKDAYMEQATATADSVIEQQSLDIDAISGATLTSDTILKAIENALEQGK